MKKSLSRLLVERANNIIAHHYLPSDDLRPKLNGLRDKVANTMETLTDDTFESLRQTLEDVELSILLKNEIAMLKKHLEINPDDEYYLPSTPNTWPDNVECYRSVEQLDVYIRNQHFLHRLWKAMQREREEARMRTQNATKEKLETYI